MKITTKINLITTAWILFVLLSINAVVFFSFMNITVNVEEEGLRERANDMISVINEDDTPAQIKRKLTPYLASHSFIRIIHSNSKVIHEVTNDRQLAKKIKGKFADKLQSQTYTIRQSHGEEQLLVIRMPIKSDSKVYGTLEIGQRLMGLELGKDVLLTILVFCTILGGVLALLGGRWLSNFIMRPISNMIDTMEDIEKSGIPKKISIQHKTRDELQKMAVTFNRMIGRLEINLEKQKQFISDASHELKTPLTVIKSYSDLLRRRGIKNEKESLEAIDTIYSEAARMQQMTERFLDLANTEIELKVSKKEVNLITLCQNLFKQLKGVYKREISLHFTQSPITVSADELKIKQVIIILLDNAMKYSTDEIDVYLDKNERSTIIRVKDYGIGIPENELANIFERFYRVDKARSRETGGAGLGLAIAKNIIGQHAGEIKVTSKEGSGTEVELILPNDV